VFQFAGFRQFLPDSSLIQKIAPSICKIIPTGCDDFLFLIVGYSTNLNASRIDVYVSETPADTSVKNIAHWAQGIRKEVFGKYDYGYVHLSSSLKKALSHFLDVILAVACFHARIRIIMEPKQHLFMTF